MKVFLLLLLFINLEKLKAEQIITKVASIPKEQSFLSYGEAPMEYIVQPGDTLLDICDQLLNKPQYWKKLWALNPEIRNPNFIYPGMKIKFYPKNGHMNPALLVVSSSQNPAVQSGIINSHSTLFRSQRFDLPGFDEDPYDSLKNLEKLKNKGKSNIDELFLTYPVMTTDLKEDEVDVPGFVLEAPINSICDIVSGEDGESLTVGGSTSKAMCELKTDLSLNMTYTILRPREPVLDDSEKNVLGYLYEFIAHIRLDSIVGDNKYALGSLYRTRTPAEEGDKLVPYMSTLRRFKTIEENEKHSTIHASEGVRVVSFEDEGKEVGGLGSFVFLDKGEITGIKKNQILSVHAFYSELVETGVLKDYPNQVKEIGALRIVDTTPVGSLGYIVKSKQEIKVGDYVGL